MEGAMVALAAQGEDNFARNDLALLEISAGDHRDEVLNNKKKIMVNFFFFIFFFGISARWPMTRVKNIRIIHTY